MRKTYAKMILKMKGRSIMSKQFRKVKDECVFQDDIELCITLEELRQNKVKVRKALSKRT